MKCIFSIHLEHFLVWHKSTKLQANHTDGKIKCATLKAHRFSRERAKRKHTHIHTQTLREGSLIQFCVRSKKDKKHFQN